MSNKGFSQRIGQVGVIGMEHLESEVGRLIRCGGLKPTLPGYSGFHRYVMQGIHPQGWAGGTELDGGFGE